MPSIFSKIINGEIPSYNVNESDKCLAFLDAYPLKRGHTLVVPKKEVDYLFDLESEDYKILWEFARDTAKAIKKVVKCKRVAVVVIGLEVPHAHIHLIPMDTIEEINFSLPKLTIPESEMEEISRLIQSAI